MEVEELVYACTEHNDYACGECVSRAVRLTVDALLDECAMVERELGQFSQDLGLGVSELEEAAVNEVVGGDVAMRDVAGTEWDGGLRALARSGLVAASWVAGRRRATRKVTGWLGGSKESGGLVDVERREVEEVEEVDTLWASSGDDLAPQSPNHAKEAAKEVVLAPQAHGHPAVLGVDGTGWTAAARPETLKEAADQRKARMRDEVTGRRSHHCVPAKEEELQQQQHSERTKRKAGENTMMERLDGDEGIE